jgi:tellurite methyltransferase
METNNPWARYYKNVEGRPPHTNLVEAMEYVGHRDSALDLGAGSMRDTKYLLEQGFAEVVAVDSEPTIAEQAPTDERLQVQVSSFEDYNFPTDQFDLINAQFSLPFTNPGEFERVFASIKNSLKKGGVFVGQLFGDKDEWQTNQNMTFLTKDSVDELISDMEVLQLKEQEGPGGTVAGDTKYSNYRSFANNCRYCSR